MFVPSFLTRGTSAYTMSGAAIGTHPANTNPRAKTPARNIAFS
jgi:hypothetical protein